MVRTMKVKSANMYSAAQRGFINATDLADYLTKRGMPFRTAYKITGRIVADCIARGSVLDELSLDDYRKYSELIEEDVYTEISLESCVKKRISEGSTGPESVDEQIKLARLFIESHRD
jgi:argininosuccinate lyase